MCSYEKAGWPGYRDLGFCDRDLGNRDGNFSHKHSSPDTGTDRDETILTEHGFQWLVRSLTSQGNCFYTGVISRFPYSECFCICSCVHPPELKCYVKLERGSTGILGP